MQVLPVYSTVSCSQKDLLGKVSNFLVKTIVFTIFGERLAQDMQDQADQPLIDTEDKVGKKFSWWPKFEKNICRSPFLYQILC